MDVATVDAMVLPSRTRPACDADERTQLIAWWNMKRALMIEETGRHAGRLDLVRELLDGSEGCY
ncbi:hypothetical protein QFZ56_000389 [Streptomyces achromogenes]|uniref:Uncharacterized protein n=2 Tax=Streptomyces achromogenes TaxID=67255 RepID=A0ABU0PSQ5_STRAH|nr:hypothetical protein [Streptomyces achromogenes]